MPQRYVIVGITAVAALWMYIDRVCFSTLATPMKAELLVPLAPEPADADALTDNEVADALKKKFNGNPPDGAQLAPEEVAAVKKMNWADKRMSYALGAFFFTYALFQIPMGSLADRYGARRVLALSIAAWSLVTMMTGFVIGFVALLAIRLLLGATEAGAYPAAAGLIKVWAAPHERGRCSSVVALGGRTGGAIAPWLTAAVAAALAGVAVVEWLVPATPAPPNPDGTPAANWRGVFFVYGFCGLAVAALFYLAVRDRPAAAPNASTPEPDGQPDWHAMPDGEGATTGATARGPELTLLERVARLARTRNMQLIGGVQFGVNIGWAFIITLLPTYLKEAFGVPLEQVGPMQSAALAIGCLGMIFGGVFTDWLRLKLGPRLGRSVPVVGTIGGCAAVFLILPLLPTAWAVVVALGVMAFLVDMHNPALWSFAQDVGGKNVGAALGWGNMWGNLGAALSPVLLTQIRFLAGWNTAFVCCGVAFACAAACGLLLDATKPVDTEVSSPKVRKS
jgi:MFS family permease